MQKKRLAPQKCYMFTQREWRSMAQIYLIQMHDFRETLPLWVQKLALQNCKGDVNAWSRVLFQLANRDFPLECTNLYCFFNPVSTWNLKKKPRSAKTAAKLVTTGIDFLNKISAGHTSLIQVYRCHKTLNRNYHEVVCEVIERASNSSTGKRRAWLVTPSLDFWVCFLCLFVTILADLISFLQIQSWQPAGSSSTVFLGYFHEVRSCHYASKIKESAIISSICFNFNFFNFNFI